MEPHLYEKGPPLKRLTNLHLVVMAAFAAMILIATFAVAGGAHADPITLDSGTTVDAYRTGDPSHYGRQFRIDVDGPVTLTVRRASTISSSGGCRTTMTGTSGPHRSPTPTGAVCDGPGTVIGDTPIYDYYTCVDGVWTRDNLTVVADGVTVFDDTNAGACPEPTTTTTVAPTTTIPPTTTTTIPGTRHCVSWVNKPTRHCVKWSS
jgi:hypothetical protein